MVDAGGTAEVVAPRPGMVETMRHLDRADRFPVDTVTEQAHAADYDAAVLPGGVANPDALRTDAPAVGFPVPYALSTILMTIFAYAVMLLMG